MILSFEHRFIFIKGHKVGGTSIEMALSALCGPADIVTPITPFDEKVRLASGIKPRNFAGDVRQEREYLDRVAAGDGKHSPDWLFRNHMPLCEVFELVPQARAFNVFFVERNPYAKVVSLALWRSIASRYKYGGETVVSREDARKAVAAIIKSSTLNAARNIERYTVDGAVVGTMLRQESLAADFAGWLGSMGLPSIDLPNAKRTMEVTGQSAREILAPEQIAKINDIYADEFEQFGYARMG